MMCCARARFPLLAGLIVLCWARSAPADSSSCSRVGVRADASVMTRWPRLLDDVHEAFDARVDIDRCARVELRSRGTSVALEVVLPDGRSATRTASRREDIVPTLEALLLVPPRIDSVEPVAPERPESKSTPPVVRLDSSLADGDARVPPVTHPSSQLRIELSALTGARIGDGQGSVGVGALSILDLSGWLVGFAGRADHYQMLTGGPSVGALELAVLGGRRLRFQTIALDLFAGAAPAIEAPTGRVSPRLLFGGHVTLGALSMLRPFIGIDGELGPPRGGPRDADAPQLPIWTLGLALGATVGTQ